MKMELIHENIHTSICRFTDKYAEILYDDGVKNLKSVLAVHIHDMAQRIGKIIGYHSLERLVRTNSIDTYAANANLTQIEYLLTRICSIAGIYNVTYYDNDGYRQMDIIMTRRSTELYNYANTFADDNDVDNIWKICDLITFSKFITDMVTKDLYRDIHSNPITKLVDMLGILYRFVQGYDIDDNIGLVCSIHDYDGNRNYSNWIRFNKNISDSNSIKYHIPCLIELFNHRNRYVDELTTSIRTTLATDISNKSRLGNESTLYKQLRDDIIKWGSLATVSPDGLRAYIEDIFEIMLSVIQHDEALANTIIKASTQVNGRIYAPFLCIHISKLYTVVDHISDRVTTLIIGITNVLMSELKLKNLNYNLIESDYERYQKIILTMRGNYYE